MPDVAEARRDVRVDRIGLVQELWDNWIGGKAGLQSKVKGAMKEGETVQGNKFFARLDATTKTTTTVDMKALYKLVEDKTIKLSEFLDLIDKIDEKKAAKIIHPKVLAAIVTKKENDGTPRLVVDRLPGVELKLVDVIRALKADEPIESVPIAVD